MKILGLCLRFLKMPIDYSKWKDIEVSDDEDDTHPNIDTASLFRWRHQARLERMASQKQEREGIEDGKRKVSTRLKVNFLIMCFFMFLLDI